MKKAVIPSLLVLVLFAAAAPAQQAPSFAGTWETTFGVMTLTQDGDKVTGHYVYDGEKCPVEGKVEKNKLTFTYKEPTVEGEGEFELAADGKTFKGKWREKGQQDWADWEGKRVAAKEAKPTGFDGLWETTFGRMRMNQEGDVVKGSYTYSSGSSVEGKVEKNKLTFTYKEPSAEGEAWFELAADGNSFKGKWKEKGATEWKEWAGKRVQPVKGRVWLIVAEVNWENHLAEQEYSYGAMLKSFFTRNPNVQVRQRFFTDEAGLRKWLNEVQYLAEPTVVSLSTHGSPQGVSADGKSIGATPIAESLRHAKNVKLLHLGGCECLKEGLADEILKSLGSDAHFPVSGYKTSVDWAASAVIEFMYYDLLLSHGMKAEDAAKHLEKLMPFSGDKKVQGAPFASAGFRLVTPSKSSMP